MHGALRNFLMYANLTIAAKRRINKEFITTQIKYALTKLLFTAAGSFIKNEYAQGCIGII